jgi:endonuclease/exonuclease/phosphatase family metal-dependent hydrolase
MRIGRTIVVCLVLGAVGCDDAEEEGLHVGTFNGGLAEGLVPLTEERIGPMIDAITGQDLDVLCVQEFWRGEDMSALRAAASAKWSNQYVPAPLPGEVSGTTPACEAAALAPLEACATTSCTDSVTESETSCVLDACTTELEGLTPSCSGCLAANLGAGIDFIVDTCTTSASTDIAFGGSFGLGLFSRYPLLEQDFLTLDASYSRRGVIYARVNAPNVGDVHLFCTHLSAIDPGLPHPTGSTWEAEQSAQIEALRAFVQEKTEGAGQVVILGDFNTGPAVGTTIAAEAPSNYALLADGFVNPYLEEADPPACTFCSTNPLVPDDEPSVAIDHILVRDLDADNTSARFLTSPLDLVVDGTSITTAYSDHYGMRAALVP